MEAGRNGCLFGQAVQDQNEGVKSGAVHISLSVADGRGGGAPRVKGKDPENSQTARQI